MKEAESGEFPRPLWIAAESVCNNGSGLIHFKRGAFDSLCAIKPCVYKFDQLFPGISQAYDVTPLECQFMLWQTKILSDVTIYSLPLFIPNEYFFKTFAHKGETKADIYAWAVRDVMGRATQLRLYDEVRIRDKLKYQEEIGLVR